MIVLFSLGVLMSIQLVNHKRARQRGRQRDRAIYLPIVPLFLVCLSIGLAGCQSRVIEQRQAEGKLLHANAGDPAAIRHQPRTPALRVPLDVWKASVRIYVPIEDGRSRTRQGVGVKTVDGEIVTALHVFGDPATIEKRMKSARVETFHNGIQQSLSRTNVIGNEYRDTAVVQTRDFVNTKLAVRHAEAPPVPGELAHALLMSTKRGQRSWTISSATVLGYSKDGAFFAMAGPAKEGDSGGAVLNGKGELVGIVIGGGAKEIGFPFRVEWMSDGHFKTVWLDAPGTRLFKGPFTICARPQIN